tara:strand:+ start:2128 stop:2784 length:657 start_codon:yes stop_codon:yes gene_type:complete
MKGFPMIEGTEPMKKMKEGAMKKMHASPNKKDEPDYLKKRKLDYNPQSQQGKNNETNDNLPRLGGTLTKVKKKILTGTNPPNKKMHDGAMKKMHDGAMKKMHDGAMKAMKAPMKKMEGAMKAMDGAMKAMSPKKMAHSPKKMAHSPKNMGHSPTKAMSPKKKTELSGPDKKRFNNLLDTLNKMNDPQNSNRAKTIVKELKKLKPDFDPADYTMGQANA